MGFVVNEEIVKYHQAYPFKELKETCFLKLQMVTFSNLCSVLLWQGGKSLINNNGSAPKGMLGSVFFHALSVLENISCTHTHGALWGDQYITAKMSTYAVAAEPWVCLLIVYVCMCVLHVQVCVKKSCLSISVWLAWGSMCVCWGHELL